MYPTFIQILRTSWLVQDHEKFCFITPPQAGNLQRDMWRLRLNSIRLEMRRPRKAGWSVLWDTLAVCGGTAALLKAMHSKTQFSGQAEFRCWKKKLLSGSQGGDYDDWAIVTPCRLHKLAVNIFKVEMEAWRNIENVGQILPQYIVSHATVQWILQTTDFTAKYPKIWRLYFWNAKFCGMPVSNTTTLAAVLMPHGFGRCVNCLYITL